MVVTKTTILSSDVNAEPIPVAYVIDDPSQFPGGRARVFLRNIGEGPVSIGTEQSPNGYHLGAGEPLEFDTSSPTVIVAAASSQPHVGTITGTDRRICSLIVSRTQQDFKLKAV